MDVSAAYDNVQIDILCDKLVSIQCSANVVKIINLLFSKRQLFFYFDGHHTETRTGYKGLAQGSTLSPLLFNIYTLDIGKNIPFTTKILQYADDIVVYSSGSDCLLTQRIVQSAIGSLNLQYESIGLAISPSKSEFMVFSRKYKLPPFQILLDNIPLNRSYSFKYLGVIFDPKCSWKNHVNYVSKKCIKRINFMRTISGSSWGAHPDALLLLYKMTIRSVLEYGSSAFLHLASTHRTQLQRIQWRALRVSLGLMSSTHTGSLEAIAGIPPLDLRWRYLHEKHTCKSLSSPSILLRSSLLDLRLSCPTHPRIALTEHLMLIEESERLPCYSFALNEVLYTPDISWHLRDALASGIQSPTQILALFKEAVHTLNTATWVYTDGSQSIDDTGSAAYIDENTFTTSRLKKPASVFHAELSAVLLATNFICTQPPASFIIASDSMSVLTALENNAINAKSSIALYRCRSELYKLSQKDFNVTLIWVPAHCGIPGNERADELAKDASINGPESAESPEWSSYLPSLKKKPSYNGSKDGTLGTKAAYAILLFPKYHYTRGSRSSPGY